MIPTYTTGTWSRFLQLLPVALVLALPPAQAGAQDMGQETGQETGSDTGERRQIGPFGVSPRVSWQTEYDDNVFHSAAQPIADFVSSFGARTGIRGRSQRVGLTANVGADWVHYSKLISERGGHLQTGLKVDFLFNRITPYVSTAFNNSRERVNPEIDLRPRYKTSNFVAGGLFRVGGKTALDVTVGRASLAYDKDAAADGVSLSDALNRASNHVGVSILQDVTPVTRVFVTGQVSRDQFEAASLRNSDNVHLLAGFESSGRIKGRARAGVRVRRPQNTQLSESRGFFLGVGTSATVLDRMQIGLNADRDFEPSYRPEVDYYESYGYTVTMSVAIRRAVRIQALAGRRHSDYSKTRTPLLPGDQSGVDRETRYGTGISYRLGEFMSFDVSGTYTDRKSVLAPRQYDGLSLRAGVSHAF